MSEFKKLSLADDAGALPVSAEAAIFARQDESRMDTLKVLLSGPADAVSTSQMAAHAPPCTIPPMLVA